MSLILFGFVAAFLFDAMWTVLAMVILTFASGCIWMWPNTKKEVL